MLARRMLSIAFAETLDEFARASSERYPRRKARTMKRSVGIVSVAAATICFAPLLSLAQNIVSKPGTVDRSIERLTLLPGPNLLSPARTTPTMMPAPVKMQQTGSFRFVPASERFISGEKGTLRLVDRPILFDNVPQPRKANPPMESLRFESTLRSPVAPLQNQIKSVPTPQN
jgi:hypothetical protein